MYLYHRHGENIMQLTILMFQNTLFECSYVSLTFCRPVIMNLSDVCQITGLKGSRSVTSRCLISARKQMELRCFRIEYLFNQIKGTFHRQLVLNVTREL